MGKFRSTTDVVPAIYKPGEKFAQLVIVPIPDVQLEEVTELSETDRGEGSYGSTDEKISAATEENKETEPAAETTEEVSEQAA